MSGYCPDCGNTQCLCAEIDKAELAALREAALWLTKSCRDRLPWGQLEKIDEEIRKVESLAKQEKSE